MRIDLAEFRVWKSRDRRPETLAGAVITDVTRAGKHTLVATDRGVLVISYGRAGWARWHGDGSDDGDGGDTDGQRDEPPVVATLETDRDGPVHFTEAADWLSFSLALVEDAHTLPAIAALGPDPARSDYTRADFDGVVVGRRKQLKALLQEQKSFAGVGNAYSDEILHIAGLSPLAQASTLTEDERDRLYDALRSVLHDAVTARATVPIAHQKAAKTAAMRVHGRAHEACPVCGGVIHDVPGSRGGAQYCPGCQTSGVPLT